MDSMSKAFAICMPSLLRCCSKPNNNCMNRCCKRKSNNLKSNTAELRIKQDKSKVFLKRRRSSWRISRKWSRYKPRKESMICCKTTKKKPEKLCSLAQKTKTESSDPESSAKSTRSLSKTGRKWTINLKNSRKTSKYHSSRARSKIWGDRDWKSSSCWRSRKRSSRSTA